MTHERTAMSTRRHLIGGAAGAAVGLALTRLGSAQGTPEATPGASPNASPASGEWTFTDDKGVTVTLPSRPERLVVNINAAAPLWDFNIRPVAVFGVNLAEDGGFGDAGGNVDPNAVEIVGDIAEPIRPEAVVAQNPDLIITNTSTPDDPEEYWSIAPDLLPQMQGIAPVIAMSSTGSADVNTERFAELANALGADLEAPDVVEAEARYEAATTAFTALAAEKADLTALFLYVDTETVYVANPPFWDDLAFYGTLGLNIVVPENADGFWEQLSLEQALKYPADILMQSTRPAALSPEELQAHPSFGAHPAVAAGQIGGWNQDFITSYHGMADALEAMLPLLTEAEDVTD